MWQLIAIRKVNSEKGFNLLEVVLVSVIIGIMAAVGVPNLLESQRDARARETFKRIQGALIEAQFNANRLSQNCTVQITSTQVSGNPSGCVLEPIAIDNSIVSVTRQGFTLPPQNISFSFRGTTGNSDTIWITRKDFSGNAMESTARCIVVSPMGMIRTGINNGGSCVNPDNLRYRNP